MTTPFRIAMVGPQPPEHSGIAEYAAGLVAMLRKTGIAVDTVTLAEVQRHGLERTLGKLREMDAVVYQVGNHPAYHGWMLPLMSAVPGIVHLHDLVLHHMAAGVLNVEQRLTGSDYPAMLEKWHTGSEVRRAASALRSGTPIWNLDEVIEYPLHQVATKFATQVIVHSNYSANRVSGAFPWLPVNVIPQLYPAAAPHRARKRLDTIAILGGGQMNRRFDWIVQALAAIDADLDHALTLEIAGEAEPAVQVLLDSIAALANIRVVNHGRVNDETFQSVFERADLMIALRQPTMGEASAVVSKALQAGLPTIVSDHGWYAELPACVRKIAPSDRCPAELADMLRQLAADPSALVCWAEECAEQAGAAEFDAAAATERYARLLRTSSVLSGFRDRVAEAIVSLRVDIDSPLSSELHRIDVRSTLKADRWVNAALAALDDQELDSHARILGGTVGPYPYSEPLPEYGFRGQASILTHSATAVTPSSMVTVQVELINEGELAWISPHGNTIRPFGIYLGHYWSASAADSTQSPAEQPRTWIEEPVEGSSSGVHVMTVRAPELPGDYCLEIDLVQESVCWFKGRGFIPARLQVHVEAAQP